MKYVTILGLLAVAATALMAFAAAASATTLTDKTNATAPYEGDIHAVAVGGLVIQGPAEVVCHIATFNGKVTNKGGKDHSETVKIELTGFYILECTGGHVTVGKLGNMEIHTDKTEVNDGNGTVTWNDAAWTVQHTSLGLTCEYTASAVDFGTLSGSRKTVDNKHPTAAVETEAVLPRTGGSFFCGSSAKLLAYWVITTPSYLDVD